MIKKALILGMAGTMLFASMQFKVDAKEADKIEIESKAEQKIMSFSLKDAKEYALENSRDMEIQRLELQKAEVVYEDNIRGIKTAEKNIDYMPMRDSTGAAIPDADINIALVEKGVSRRSVTLPYQIAKWNVDMKENQVKYNIEKAYFDYLQMQKELEIAEENLKLAQKQYKNGNLKFDVGIISKQQLLGLEMGMLQAQGICDSTKMYFELQFMSFQNTLGVPFNQQIKLTDKIEYKKYEPIDLAKSIKIGLENNIGIKISQESYELSKLTLDAIKGRYPENTYRYREQAAEVAKAAKTLESSKNGVEMGIRSAYLNLQTAEKQIKTYEITIKQAEEALRLAEISFDLGQNTATEIAQANINLMNAKSNLSKQIHSFNMGLLDFEYSIGKGKGY